MNLRLPLTLALVCASLPPIVHCQNQPTPPAAPTILQDYDQAIDDIAEKAMRSVVEIEVTGYGVPEHDDEDNSSQMLQRQRSLGSGVIVDPDGYIVTNNHVVSGALRIRVILSPATVEMVPYHTSLARRQRVYEAKLIGTNRYADLAVIKIEEKNLPTIALPDQQFRVRLGQTVLAIGSPQGLDHTITKGIVSAVGRQPELDRPMVYVQTDAPINPGNSGGPLIARGFVPSVSIGAHAQAITPDLATGLKLPLDHGVIFSDIDKTGPAADAGLRSGDIVELMDGVPIDSFPKYTAYLYIHKRGTPLRMEVLRSGKPVTLFITAINSLPTVDSLSDLTNPRKDLIPSLGVF